MGDFFLVKQTVNISHIWRSTYTYTYKQIVRINNTSNLGVMSSDNTVQINTLDTLELTLKLPKVIKNTAPVTPTQFNV